MRGDLLPQPFTAAALCIVDDRPARMAAPPAGALVGVWIATCTPWPGMAWLQVVLETIGRPTSRSTGDQELLLSTVAPQPVAVA